jgi:AraC family transcriptional regulator
MNTISNKLTQALFNQRENDIVHLPYDYELSFYDAVKKGDIETVKKRMLPLTSAGLGHLSDDPLRNLQYHFIITAAFITRFCIEGGMDSELAYTLSDLYIQKVDLCKSCEEVNALHQQMIYDLTKRMHGLQYKNVYPKNIVICIDYINSHLHTRFSIPDLAAIVNLHPNYLCSLFKKETCITLAHFIRIQRINAAKNLLKYSEHSCLDIGNYLVFSSYSHFISIFKKEAGLTPQEYRNKYFRHNWSNK